MSSAIQVSELSKRYRIRRTDGAAYRTLREEIVHAATAPLRWLTGKRAPPPEDFWALRDVSFTVPPGEVMGVIGRNGAGKSTLLKILSRVTRPTHGRVEMRGRVGSLLEVGTGFHPELTGRENIFLSGAILGMKRRDIVSRFDEIVDFAGIERFLDTPVKRYSSGMYVRLGFSLAAHLAPDILIVDEVLAVGDAEFRRRCLGKMNAVASEGRTVVFVSHDLVAVEMLCRRVMVLANGQIAFDGGVREALGNYLPNLEAAAAERTWESPSVAPGNSIVRLKRVAVCDERNVPVAGAVERDQPLTVEIDYWNLTDDVSLGVTVVLYAPDGSCILSSLSNLDASWHGKPRKAGVYRSRCRLPVSLFNAGEILVTVLVWSEGYTIALRRDDVVRFTVSEDVASRGDYTGDLAGAIHPRLDWDTARLDGDGSRLGGNAAR